MKIDVFNIVSHDQRQNNELYIGVVRKFYSNWSIAFKVNFHGLHHSCQVICYRYRISSFSVYPYCFLGICFIQKHLLGTQRHVQGLTLWLHGYAGCVGCFKARTWYRVTLKELVTNNVIFFTNCRIGLFLMVIANYYHWLWVWDVWTRSFQNIIDNLVTSKTYQNETRLSTCNLNWSNKINVPAKWKQSMKYHL